MSHYLPLSPTLAHRCRLPDSSCPLRDRLGRFLAVSGELTAESVTHRSMSLLEHPRRPPRLTDLVPIRLLASSSILAYWTWSIRTCERHEVGLLVDPYGRRAPALAALVTGREIRHAVSQPSLFAKERAFTLRVVANKVGRFWPEFRSQTPLAPQKRRKNFLDFGFDRQIEDKNGPLCVYTAKETARSKAEGLRPKAED